MNLDKNISTVEERVTYIKNLLLSIDSPTQKELSEMSDYILQGDKKIQKYILTNNKMVTINKRETSFQGLASNFESGEDGVYNLILDEEDKNFLFTPKISITKKDLEEIPELKELKQSIKILEQKYKENPSPQLKKQIIELRKDQYVIKNTYKKPITFVNIRKSSNKITDLEEKITISPDLNDVTSSGLVNFFNHKHIVELLVNYSKLKEESHGKFWTDLYYLMEDLDKLIEDSLKEKHPAYFELLINKIDGKSNFDISLILNQKFNIKYSEQTISQIWRKRIPNIMAETAKQQYIEWFLNKNKKSGKWKKCSVCKKIKIANKYNFNSNKLSHDGLYCQCKECRKEKNSGTNKTSLS